MKISDLAMESDGVWMDVYFDDMKQDARLLLVGTNSDQYARYEKKLQDRFLKNGGKKLKSSDLQELNVDKHIYCCMNWENMEDENGNPMPCSFENKKAIFGDKKKYKWLIDQIEEFINEDSNFLSMKSMEESET